MSPTVLRYGKYRLFFFSREEERIHVHVTHPDGEAKFWLTPYVHPATATGLDQRQIQEAQAIIQNHVEAITDAWDRHFRT